MPVYLCKPGCWCVHETVDSNVYTSSFGINIFGLFCRATEPWRHGIQVYAFPFPIDSKEVETEERTQGVAIRRVRHAEVVLVDDVCIAHGRYWLRLKWPGTGGFAGYIALGASSPFMTRQTTGKCQYSVFKNLMV